MQSAAQKSAAKCTKKKVTVLEVGEFEEKVEQFLKIKKKLLVI